PPPPPPPPPPRQSPQYQPPPAYTPPPAYPQQQYRPTPVYPPPEPETPPSKFGWLKTTTNLFAFLCGVAFVILVCLALPFLNTSERILDSEVYKKALQDENVYTRFPDLFAEQMALSQTALGKEARIDFRGVTQADWKLIATELVTPEWMQKQVESLIDEIFKATEKDAAAPTLKISLQEVTQRLSGDSGFRIYKQVIDTKEKCSLDDFFSMLDWMEDPNKGMLRICKIPPMLTDIAAFIGEYDNGDALIKDLLKELPEALPKEVSLSEFFTLPMEDVGKTVDTLKLIGGVCLFLALLALLATFISPMGRSLKGWLILWGLPLAAAGVVCLLLSFLTPSILSGVITGGFKGSIAPGVMDVIKKMVSAVVKPSATSLAVQAGLMLVAGLVMSGAGAMMWGIGKFKKP
ncbi:MAG: hypothetical protein JXB15_05860, partial [Anaerolineales bacterium]|nr:hypothetical protein [Anaerolineales bacterium]